tara:strand:- start:4398 stop:5801 length:1404 start_codon:yes stop_codon:yes gene_type:complete
MAEIIVKKSPVAEFLDELPTLIFQYKQMQIAEEQADLERADRKAARAEDILLREYYAKKEDVRKTESMFDKYDGLKPEDISSGGADIINFIDNQNNINMSALQQNLDELSNYQAELKSGLSDIQSQAQTLKEMTPSFYGLNKVLDPQEYQSFRTEALKSIEEGGLGWSTTAGADLEYYKKDPTARFAQALQITEKMKSDHSTNLKGDYGVLQAMFTPGENKDTGDLAKTLTYKDASGKEIEPDEQVVAAMQRLVLQTSPEEFMQNLNALPDEYGGRELRSLLISNPNTSTIYGNMMRNQQAIQTLDNELAGINQLPEQNRYDQFIDSISDLTNEKALFEVYNQAIEGLDPSEHGAYFSAIEAQLGGEDLYPKYAQHMGFVLGDREIVEKEEYNKTLEQVMYDDLRSDDFTGFMEEEGMPTIRETEIIEPNLDIRHLQRINIPTSDVDNLKVALDNISLYNRRKIQGE